MSYYLFTLSNFLIIIFSNFSSSTGSRITNRLFLSSDLEVLSLDIIIIF